MQYLADDHSRKLEIILHDGKENEKFPETIFSITFNASSSLS